jgi:hypothetical protein
MCGRKYRLAGAKEKFPSLLAQARARGIEAGWAEKNVE